MLAHRIYRRTDDPRYIAVDLEFAGPEPAHRFHGALLELWKSGEAAPAPAGTPQVRIVEQLEDLTY